MNRISGEFLPNNYLSKSIQAFLKPLELTHSVVGLRKFRICDSFITPNGSAYRVLSVLAILPFAAILYYLALYVFIYVTSPGLVVMHEIIYNLTFFIHLVYVATNMYNDKRNVSLILHIQEAANAVKYGNLDIYGLVHVNWISISSVWIAYGLIELIFLVLDPHVYIINDSLFLLFDITIVYATRIVVLLKKVLDAWLQDMIVRSEIDVTKMTHTAKCDWKEVERAYYHLSKAYEIYLKIFNLPMFAYFCCIFTSYMLVFQLIIELEKLRNIMNIEYVIITQSISLFWAIKDTVLFVVYVIECERFYSTVTSVNVECLFRKNMNTCSEAQRRVYKNVLRSTELCFTKIRVCSVVINAPLLISFGQLVTTHLIVLLQIAFVDKKSTE